MSNHVYKHVQITGTSKISSDDAVTTAIAKAGETIRGIHWFRVLETRGQVDGKAVKYWQVSIEIGFTLEG